MRVVFRFALGGWAIFSAAVLVFWIGGSFIGGFRSFGNSLPWMVLALVGWGIFGATGGAVLGLIALLLQRLLKRPDAPVQMPPPEDSWPPPPTA